LDHIGHMSAHAVRVEQPRIAFEGLLDPAPHCLAQWSTKPGLFRRRKTELVASLADFLGQDSTHGAPQHALGVAAHDLVPVPETDRELHEAVIEERHSCL